MNSLPENLLNLSKEHVKKRDDFRRQTFELSIEIAKHKDEGLRLMGDILHHILGLEKMFDILAYETNMLHVQMKNGHNYTLEKSVRDKQLVVTRGYQTNEPMPKDTLSLFHQHWEDINQVFKNL